MVTGSLVIVLGRLCFLIIKKYVSFYIEHQADELSGFVLLCDLAFMVFAADDIRSILSVNLVLLGFVFFLGYSGLRELKSKIQKKNIITPAQKLKMSDVRNRVG